MGKNWTELLRSETPNRAKRRNIVLLRGMMVVAVGAMLVEAGVATAGFSALALVAVFAASDVALAFTPLRRVGQTSFAGWIGGIDLLLVGLGLYLADAGAGALPVSCLLMTLVVALGTRRSNAVAGAAAVGALHAWLVLRIAAGPDVGRQLALQMLFLCSVGLYYGFLAEGIHLTRRRTDSDAAQRRELGTLLDILGDVTSSLDLGDVTSSIVEKLTTVVPAVRCSIVYVDETALKGYVVASHDDPELSWLEIDLRKYPEIRKAITTRDRVIVGNIATDPLMDEVRRNLEGLDFQSIIVLPITFGGEVLGSLCLRSARGNRIFSDREIKFLTAVAHASANALKNALLHRQVSEESERLRQTGEKLARILNHSPELIFTTDNKGRITELNRGAEALLGYSRHEVMGQPYSTLLADDEPSDLLEQVQREGVLPNHNRDLRARDGSIRELELHLSVLRQDNGEVAGTVWIGRDITELKATQMRLLQAEKLSSIGEVISGVAHELNNPLSGVLGFSQLLLARHRESPMARELEKIWESAERCRKIVKNLLSFARAHKPERKYLGLNGILEKTLELKKYQLHVNDIEVERRLDPDLPLTMVDFNQIQQVVVNLINNAQHAMAATREKKRKLTVRTSSAGDFIRAEITDNGTGMGEATVKRIFDPFFTTKEQGEGTGLGLSVSYGIVKEHGGRIWAESREGHGTTFTIELPVCREADAEADSTVAAETEAGPPSSRGHILIVDDEPLVIDLLLDVLQEVGHRVDTAANGREACRKVAVRDYDMVITDVRMPEMDGMEFYRTVLTERPQLEGKVVFVTGDLIDRTIVDFLAEVQARTIPKPLEIARIHQVIREILDPDAERPQA